MPIQSIPLDNEDHYTTRKQGRAVFSPRIYHTLL